MRLLVCVVFACSASSTGSKPTTHALPTSTPQVSPPPPVSPPVTPPPITPVEPDAELDAGVFTINDARESFSITRRNGQLHYVQGDQLLVTDLLSHPINGVWVRNDYRRRPERGGLLEGSPLELSKWTMEPSNAGLRKQTHSIATATEPVEIFVAWPIPLAWTPLCRVSTDVAWTTLDDGDWSNYVEAYRAGTIDKYTHVVAEWGDHELELVCEGDKLIAGISKHDGGFKFVRKDRPDVLALLEKHPRPVKHAWKHPIMPSAHWDVVDAYLFGAVVVAIDQQPRLLRLTAFDTATKKIATRDIATPLRQRLACRPTSAGLLCADHIAPFVRIFDPSTLGDRADLTAKVQRASKDWWASIVAQTGDRITLSADDSGVEVDVAKGTARLVRHPKEVEWVDPTLCTKTEQQGKLAAIDAPADDSRLLSCTPKQGGGYYAVARDDRLGWIDENATLRWVFKLHDEYSDQIRMVNNTFIVTSRNQARRVSLVNVTTGAVEWIGAGPFPKP